MKPNNRIHLILCRVEAAGEVARAEALALHAALAEAEAADEAARAEAARREEEARAGLRRALHAQVAEQMQSLCAIAAMCEPGVARAGGVA